jgi:hypothetical protein
LSQGENMNNTSNQAIESFKYIKTPIVCAFCNKKAKSGWLINGKTYADQCAADELGLTLVTLNKLKN